MTSKEIYQSIDQSKISPKGKDFLQKAEKSTKGFTIQNDKLDSVMKKLYADLKAKKPEALKDVKTKTVEKEVKVPTTKTEQKKEPKRKTKTVKKKVKKATGKKKNTKPTKTPSEPKEGKKEHISTRAKKLADKEGISFKEARARLSKEAKEQLKKDEKQADKELDKLLKFVRKDSFEDGEKYPKIYGKQDPKKSSLSADAKRMAKPVGKRVSKNGKTYYEYRDNRSDRNSLPAPKGQYKYKGKTPPYLADGGAIDSLKKDMNSKLDIHSEYYAKGGRTISIVNDGVKYDKSKYKAVYGDFDNDGTVNIDDANPLDKTKSGQVEQVELRKTFDKLLGVKAELDVIMYDAVETLDEKAPEGADIYARTKTPYSILKKLVEKRMLDPKRGLTDMIGTTIAVDNQKELEEVRDKIDGGLLGKVLDRDDFYKTPNAGYRAYHYIVEYKGVPVEVQLKTKNMKKLHEVSHEAYKNGNLDAKSLDSVSKTFMRADKGDAKAKSEISRLLKDKKLLASKVSKGSMEAGGTLPTPFGQAGLVGETGTLNEVDLFAMGGGLPQGVHQYYANTYNPAYPTPHGYAKGGQVGNRLGDFRKRLIDLGDEEFVDYKEKQLKNKQELYYAFQDRLRRFHKQTIFVADDLPFEKGGEIDAFIMKFVKDAPASNLRVDSEELTAKLKKGGKTKRSKHSLMQDRRRVSKEPWEVAYQKRKSKMESGGTLPTPFGQAGLVGETGAMNEMDMFAMGGGLPQGVHQYYANTYNPAYPTPHGYAKGGEVDGRYKVLVEKRDNSGKLYRPNIYWRGNDKNLIAEKVKKAKKDFPARKVFVTDEVGDREIYNFAKGGLTESKYIPSYEVFEVVTKDGKVYENDYSAMEFLSGAYVSDKVVSKSDEDKSQMSLFKKGGNIPKGAIYIKRRDIDYITVGDDIDDAEKVNGKNLFNGFWIDPKKQKTLIAEAKKDGRLGKSKAKVGDKVKLIKGAGSDTIFRNFPNGVYEVKKVKKGNKSVPEGFYEIENKDGNKTQLATSRFETKYAKGGEVYPEVNPRRQRIVDEIKDIEEEILFISKNPEGEEEYFKNLNVALKDAKKRLGNFYNDPKNVMAKGGKTQGYNDKLDESLGNTKGKRSTKEQNYKDRRNESEAMEKKGGKRKYARVKTMDKGNRKKRQTPMSLAKEIRKEGEKWQDAVKRASAMLKKK